MGSDRAPLTISTVGLPAWKRVNDAREQPDTLLGPEGAETLFQAGSEDQAGPL
jgi:hypothetical protein